MSEKTDLANPDEATLVATPKNTNPADPEKAPATTSENSVPTDKEQIQDELQHRTKLLRLYKNRLQMLEEQMAVYGIDAPPHLVIETNSISDNISKLEKDITSLQKAEVAVIEGKPVPKQDDDKDLLFVPEWSVLRSKIQYVDANLAYRFADASAETNTLMSFTTLFLGATISFAVSAILATEVFSMTLLWTATVFTLIPTVIFGYLSKKADDRAKEVKKQLFPVNEPKHR